MRVGCPKEIKNHEYRVGLTPGAVREYVAHGHEVLIETKAGAGIGADDAAYIAAGAKIVGSAKDVFEKSDMVVKVKEPQANEWTQLRDGQILYTYLHLAPDPEQTKGLLASSASILDTALEVGLSGPGRLHDLFVTHEAMSPGEWKLGGEGLKLSYGFHGSPFGEALVVVTDRGLAGLGWVSNSVDGGKVVGGRAEALADMMRRWPHADYHYDPVLTAPYAGRIFDPRAWSAETPLRVVLIGTDFEVRVWETLLRIPVGCATTYGDVANHIGRPTAARAVGMAVGKNPISFVVPCHRVIGKSGALTGYHWGLTRKRAILGWEAGQAAAG